MAFTACASEWGDAMAIPKAVCEMPDQLHFPYLSTYYVEPVVRAGGEVKIGYYVTDWDHSLTRLGDGSFRFDVVLELFRGDGLATRFEKKDVAAGDGILPLGALPEGDYALRIWARERNGGLESHRVVHEFKVVGPDYGDVSGDLTYRMTEADLEKYGIDNKGTAEKSAKVGNDAWERQEEAGLGNLEGLQRFVDDQATSGVKRVVLLPGTYRLSAQGRLEMPDDFTLDLGGATLKENAFTGCHALMVAFSSARDAHLVNGVLEGDRREHDYAHSEKNSEWPMAFNFSGDCRYCSVSNVVVRDVTGYGGGNGCGKDRRGAFSFFSKAFAGEWTPGSLDAETGGIVADAVRFTSDFQDFRLFAGDARYLQVSKCGGYQGMVTESWWLTACWYDGERRLLASETVFQYRPMMIPPGARFLRVSVACASPEAAKGAGLCMCLFRVPWNCAVIDCRFEDCRCVGYAASAMKNMLFKGNEFTRCGQSLAMCAFDAEDGWDQMQDVTFLDNTFMHNPVNNGLFFCCGHNFVVERNKGDLWFLNRVYSPCVRSNDVGTAHYENGGRMRSGYGRFEGNRYAGGIYSAKTGPDGWAHVKDGDSQLPWGWMFRVAKARILNFFSTSP